MKKSFYIVTIIASLTTILGFYVSWQIDFNPVVGVPIMLVSLLFPFFALHKYRKYQERGFRVMHTSVPAYVFAAVVVFPALPLHGLVSGSISLNFFSIAVLLSAVLATLGWKAMKGMSESFIKYQ